MRRARRRPAIAVDARSRWRWRGGGCTRRMEESLRLHADDQAAVRGRPLRGGAVPPAPARRAGGAGVLAPRRSCRRRRWSAPLTGAPTGGARAPRRASTRCAQSSRPRGCATELLDGEQVVRAAVVAASTRPRADRGRRARDRPVELLGELDAPVEREGARSRPRSAAAGGGSPARASTSSATRTSASRRPRRRADDRGARTTAGRTQHGLVARGDADPPAVHAERVRARARAPPRAPAAEARLPAAVHDQPRRGVSAAGCPTSTATCRSASTRGSSASWRPASRPDLFRVSIYETAPRPRAGAEPGRARRRRSTSAPSRSSRPATARSTRGDVPPAASCGHEHAAARPRRARAGAQVPDGQRRRHAPADRDQVRVADRDPVRVRRSRPHRSSC